MENGLSVSLHHGRPGFHLDVRFEVSAGNIFAVLGPSGAGKTTLLRCLAGLISPDAAEVRLNSRNLEGCSPQQRSLGMVFRPPALFPHLTVAQNVAFGAKGPIDEFLMAFECMEFATRYPRQLSAGEQQRTALARAFATRPRLLLLDEPFTALDGPLRLRLIEVVRRMVKVAGIPAVVVTHDLDEACGLGDRLGLLVQGKFLQEGLPTEVLEQPVSSVAAALVGATNLFVGGGDGACIDWEGLLIECGTTLNGAVQWGIRPENVHLTRLNTGDKNCYAGAVSRVVREKDVWRVTVNMGNGKRIFVTVSSREWAELALSANEPIWVTLPPERVLVFSLPLQG